MSLQTLRRRYGALPGVATALLLCFSASSASASRDDAPDRPNTTDQDEQAPYDADGHAPIGVMGDHVHGAGEFMLSYRYMPMAMTGLQDGTAELSDAESLAVDNPFFGRPGQPPKMRILPREMTMNMHMFGAMYGLTDRVTLMGMGMTMARDMTLETHNMPGNPIGTFDTATSGFIDASLTALIGLSDGPVRAHLLAGVGLPAGRQDLMDNALLPNGMTREVRLPYAMQLGSGTWDAQPGIVVQTRRGKTSIGGQFRARIRTGENAEGYRLGNNFLTTAWAMYQPIPAAALTARLQLDQLGGIEGQDSMIVGPVPTADPANYGGSRLMGLVGLNLAGQGGAIREHRLAFELGIPLAQNLNGPQMPCTWHFMVGWQRAWSLLN